MMTPGEVETMLDRYDEDEDDYDSPRSIVMIVIVSILLRSWVFFLQGDGLLINC